MCAICCQQANSLNDGEFLLQFYKTLERKDRWFLIREIDLESVSSACGFTQGAYNQASASSVAATVVVTATHAGSTTTVSAASSAKATGASAASGSSASSSKNAAPAPTGMGAAGLLAGAIVAGLAL
jgi:hypothetical protein